MKKILLLSALILSSIGGTSGCGKTSVPFSPTAQSLAPASPDILSPRYVGEWSQAESSALSNPMGIATDGTQYVYVTDASLDEVLKYDLNGNLQGHWGNTGNVTLDQPSGIALKNGNIYVADSANSRIVEYDSLGNVLGILQPTDGAYYLFVYPTGISFDSNGNMYVSDNSDKVYQFNSALALTNQWNAQNTLDFPAGSAEDASGNIYVANYNSNNVVKINSQLNTVTAWGQTGSQSGQFNGPSDIKLDSKGNVAVVDTDNDRIQIFSPAGTFVNQWGPNADPTKSLNSPSSLAFDSNGFIYVVDAGNSRIVKYSAN